VRRSAGAAGLDNIETVECAADDLDATQSPFDAAISRLGLMLFPSPRRALEAVRCVLTPGARFAALVFTTPADNPFMAQPMAILLRHAGKSPPERGQPGIFALGRDGILEHLMKDSGLVDVETRAVRAPLSLPRAFDALEMMQQAFGAYRAVVADLSDTERSKAWNDVHECLKQFETGNGFTTGLEFNWVGCQTTGLTNQGLLSVGYAPVNATSAFYGPACLLLALRVISRGRSSQVAFGEKRTSIGRQDRPVRSRMTHFGSLL